MTTQIIKAGEKAQLRKDGEVYEVASLIWTASGIAHAVKLFDSEVDALAWFENRETSTIPTNGYERYTNA